MSFPVYMYVCLWRFGFGGDTISNAFADRIVCDVCSARSSSAVSLVSLHTHHHGHAQGGANK